MIHVYYSSGDYAQDRFMYDRIAGRMPADTILLVPDQFTLQAEEDALRCMRADALLNLEVMSRSSFSRRVLGSTGRPGGVPVNKYGRYMLLSSLLKTRGQEPRDDVFSGMLRGGRQGRDTLAHLLNDEISELKQFGVSPDDLRGIAESFSGDVLGDKLSGTADIYSAYSEKIEGRFSDGDDLQAAVAERLPRFQRAADAVFWLYGFDYMSPDMMDLVCAIAAAAPEVNIVLTGECDGAEEFDLFLRMTALLHQKCTEHGQKYAEEHIPENYRVKRETQVSIVKAGSFYEEAETLAADILTLVREEGLRFRDIAVICNDLETRGEIIARVFAQYGIPLFVDSKRSVLQEPAVEFICALIDCSASGRRLNDVFRMLGTGFGPLTDTQCSRLEMYCRRYHIRSGRWKKDFVYGVKEEGSDGLAEINRCRQAVFDFMEAFEKLFRKQDTVREKTAALYYFLTDIVEMPGKLDQAAAELEARGLYEYAEETSQIWKIIVDIMDQMVEVIGEETLEAEEYGELLREGFGEVEIGIIPSTADQVLLGNVHRTRTGSIRALFVSGANDGVLPEESDEESLFSDMEKQEIAAVYGRSAGSTGLLKNMEQDLAVYRNLIKAGERLTISYAAQDLNGSELRPSPLVGRYLRRFGKDILRPAVSAASGPLRLIQTPGGTLPHLAGELRHAYEQGEEPADEWKAAALVLDGDRRFENMKRGLFYSRRSEALDRANVAALYGRGDDGELVLSASRIEKFVHCPFSFFVQYGLNPSENREFDADVRSVGDIFHYCMKRLTAALTRKGVPVTAPDSPWMTVTEDELRTLIAGFADDFAGIYREGVFGYEARDRYIRERAEDVIYINARIMVGQVRKGHIRAIHFETDFGPARGSAFPPIRLELGDGGVVYLEGRIDRVDELDGGESSPGGYIRVIDYKTGADKFKKAEVEAGAKLQLMIYLRGALGGIRDVKPAGVFYFPAGEKTEDISEQPGAEEEIPGIGKTRLDGALVRDDDVVEDMDATMDVNETSEVIPVRRSGNGYVNLRNSTSLMDPDDFTQLMERVDQILEEASASLAGGNASVSPLRMKGGKFDACHYCGFDNICHVKITGGDPR